MPFVGLPLTMELSYINNTLVRHKELSKESSPTELDYPNCPMKKDIKLNYWIK